MTSPATTSARRLDTILSMAVVAFFAVLGALFFSSEWGYLCLMLISGRLSIGLPQQLQNFVTLTLSLVVEGLPFVILGVLFATLIRLFVSSAMLMRFLPRQRHLRRLTIACLGVFMPVCECGNVPVARGFMNQGLSTQDTTVFLLAAPIINPITFLATLAAFGASPSVAVIRVLAALGIALAVAALLDKASRSEQYLTKAFADSCHPHARRKPSWSEFLENYRAEFWLILKMLCIGALIAAATQTIVAREVLATIGSNIWLSLLSMLALSLIVSICSGVDAFFALSYANNFPIGAIITFLVAGPMINIKSLALMKSTFSLRYLLIVVPSVALLALAVGFVVNLVGVR